MQQASLNENFPLSPPRQWVDRLTTQQVLPRITVSYIPRPDGSPNRWAERHAMDERALLSLIKNDFRNGVIVIGDDPSRKDGAPQIRVRGLAWEISLVAGTGKSTGANLGSLRAVTKLKYANTERLVPLAGIDFEPVWEERKLDLEELRTRFDEIRRDTAAIEDRITRPERDASISSIKNLHGMARKQYSALRAMMGLLHLKSEQDQLTLEGVVASKPDDSPETKEDLLLVDDSLAVILERKAPPDLFDVGSRIEVTDGERHRPYRASVTHVEARIDSTLLVLDLPASCLREGAAVQINCLSRFGMWAHRKALEDFINENVSGYWQNLARLLCAPESINPPNQNCSIERFFCDEQPGAPKLNERQRQAVVGAVNAPSAFCIQGPPGTGKTTVICEVIQQLLARGQRVLMVAPTHVAIDELLRRVGARPGVRAVRLSWDDSRIAEDVRRYAPGSIINPLFDAIRTPNVKRLQGWRREQAALEDLQTLLSGYLQALAKEREAKLTWTQSKHRLDDFEKQVDRERPKLLSELEEATKKRPLIEEQSHELMSVLQGAEKQRIDVESKAGFGARLLSVVGAGTIGNAKRAQRKAKQNQVQSERELWSLTEAIRNTTNKLDRQDADLNLLRQKEAEERSAYSGAVEDRSVCEEKLSEAEVFRGVELTEDWALTELEQVSKRVKRLAIYMGLSDRFRTLLGADSGLQIDEAAIEKDVVSSANLFCCTTTGVAGSAELRDTTFDTLIVDEASRVTDSEFLIGAIRAKRWLLVGDENQLPPYVEQQDEHFIHALSALYRSERSHIDLTTAIGELGDLWLEDEEQHKFRNESVARAAEELQSSGVWRDIYREVFSAEYERLQDQVEDPTRAILEAMRTSIVRSLFERVVVNCPREGRVRLVEQRRMIEPIARIVSEPVYDGDYVSPTTHELASIGVSPLTTSTFQTPITFLDTSPLGRRGSEELIGNSFVNRSEADLIVKACRILEQQTNLESGEHITVSILAFYKAQANLIREQLSRHHFLKLCFSVIDAIDRIQGQESDVVFISFTRTNYASTVSPMFGQWLQDVRRLNVACTRAHSALFLVGQRELLGKLCSNEHAMRFYKNLTELFDRYPEDMSVIKHLDVST